MFSVAFQPPLGIDTTDVFFPRTVPRGKRQWKPFYAHLKRFLLYFAPVRVGILFEISIADGDIGIIIA